MIRGNRALAVAYMVHILDVYDHYKFRAILEQQAYERAMGKPGQKPPVGQGILDVDDRWQDKYVNGKPTKQQAYFISGNMPRCCRPRDVSKRPIWPRSRNGGASRNASKDQHKRTHGVAPHPGNGRLAKAAGEMPSLA